MKRLFCLFLLISICSNSIFAQKLSARKLTKLANKYANNLQYADAADHYMQAFKLNSNKKELLHKAAINYFMINDYRNASDAFTMLKPNFKDFPEAGLKYAFVLKNDGEYEAAKEAFDEFIIGYEGSDRVMKQRLVMHEKKGCDLAEDLKDKSLHRDIEVNPLSDNVNTIEMEYAPILFGDDLLYYTSTIGNTTSIYRSQKHSGGWQAAQKAEGLPVIEGKFGNGTFSPTNERFYFTICADETVAKDQPKINRCQLNYIQQTSDGWTAPARLPKKVNMPGATATQPNIVHIDDKEVIFYSSNRVGGKGGMDIWYTTTKIDSEIPVFTSPNNLGRMVNTIHDEVTPFYDTQSEQLYFSSNGYPTLGGFDIFASQGNLSKWQEPVHMGVPINSSADDLYFTLSPATEGNGLFVSNRLFGNQKIQTTDLDIFEFSLPETNLMVEGTVFQKATNEPIEEAKVSLYEILPTGKKRLLSKIKSKEGKFKFNLFENKRFIIESKNKGYPTGAQAFNTMDLKEEITLKKDIFVDKHGTVKKLLNTPVYSKAAVQKAPVKPTTIYPAATTVTSTPAPAPAVRNQVVTTTPKITYTTPTPTVKSTTSTTPSRSIYPEVRSNTSLSSFSDSSNNRNAYANFTKKKKMPRGEFYKIQLIAVKTYNPNHRRYREVKELARLESEYIPSRDLTRVMMGDYFSLTIAKRKLSDVVEMEGFGSAYIVRYKDGRRMGVIK